MFTASFICNCFVDSTFYFVGNSYATARLGKARQDRNAGRNEGQSKIRQMEYATTSPSVLCFLLLVAALASPLDTSISLQKSFFFSAPSTNIFRGKLDRKLCKDSVLPTEGAINNVRNVRSNAVVKEEMNIREKVYHLTDTPDKYFHALGTNRV